jgi:predicted amidohydrolase YtcJ
MARAKHALAAFVFAIATQASGKATLIENLHGYTLAGDRLQSFTGLAFDHGKVVATGDAAALHRRFLDVNVIDGQDKTLLPGMIDSHGHVLGLGFTSTQIALFGTESLQQAQDRIRTMPRRIPTTFGCWVAVGIRSNGNYEMLTVTLRGSRGQGDDTG